jgi:hypothetical protein
MSLGDLFFYLSIPILGIGISVLIFTVSPWFAFLVLLGIPMLVFSEWLDTRAIPTQTVVILPNPEGATVKGATANPTRILSDIPENNTNYYMLETPPQDPRLMILRSAGQRQRSRRSKRKART